jgi:hypothetical protein
MNQAHICPITGLPYTRIDSDSYRIEYGDEYRFIRLGLKFSQLSTQERFINNKHILAGAIFNKQLSDDETKDFYWITLTSDSFDEMISKVIYPKTPKAKLDNLFKSLYNLQNQDGEKVDIRFIVLQPEFYYKHFFKSEKECIYYLKELNYQNLINCSFSSQSETPLNFVVTFKGLNYYFELTEQGDLSNKCFVAMSFDSKMIATREAIRNAILKNNFDPIIIDEQLVDSSQTINDAIIASIKSCKFCIADFTQQKDGVYFESGFAVGLNKPVIYTCQQEWFSTSHFDTNHFPHIIYESLTELTQKLDLKIKAWIK